MKRLSDNFLTMLLPLTMVAATAFSMVAVIAFRMEATTAGFVFFTLSTIGWIGLIAELFLLYNIIIDKWFSKRPFSSDRFVVFDFAVACLYIYARQTYGLDYVYHHAFAFCRAFPVALHHRNGIRQTNKVMAGAKMEQTYPQKATGYERIG